MTVTALSGALMRRLVLAGAACASLPGWAFAQRLGGGESADVSWWRVAASLLLCLALAAGGAWALKAKMKGTPALFNTGPRRLQVLETVRLAHQVEICLLRCDDKEVFIAVSPHGAFAVQGLEAAPSTEPPPP